MSESCQQSDAATRRLESCERHQARRRRGAARWSLLRWHTARQHKQRARLGRSDRRLVPLGLDVRRDQDRRARHAAADLRGNPLPDRRRDPVPDRRPRPPTWGAGSPARTGGVPRSSARSCCSAATAWCRSASRRFRPESPHCSSPPCRCGSWCSRRSATARRYGRWSRPGSCSAWPGWRSSSTHVATAAQPVRRGHRACRIRLVGSGIAVQQDRAAAAAGVPRHRHADARGRAW